MGYALSGVCLTRHTDFYKLNPSESHSKPGDPDWIGAWWMGFFICGAIMLVISLPLFFFPKELPKTPAKVSDMIKGNESDVANIDFEL